MFMSSIIAPDRLLFWIGKFDLLLRFWTFSTVLDQHQLGSRQGNNDQRHRLTESENNSFEKWLQGLKLIGLGENVDVHVRELPVSYLKTQKVIGELWHTLNPKVKNKAKCDL